MKRSAFVAISCCLLLCTGVFANNITTTNVKLMGQNTSTNTTQVQFDISWENSWRTSSGPANWDAAWVFVKYRVNGVGAWHHASLNNTGSVAPSATVEIGLQTPGTAFNATTNPGLGAFIYRSSNGSGTFTVTSAQLQWNYGANGVGDNDLVDIQVYAIEQVYIPAGSFYLGSGGGSDNGAGTEFGSFYKYPNQADPYSVTGEGAITVGSAAGNLFYAGPYTSIGDQLGPIPASYPKGYHAFYCMKYELSQQGFVDFLNNLTYSQSRSHYDYYSNIGRNRYAIDTVYGSSAFITSAPYIACNFLSWNDLSAYLAWAGLRPMTELEFEKACRGTLFPVPHEFAWGTAGIANKTYSVANLNQPNEIITGQFSTNFGVGNAFNLSTSGYSFNPSTTGPTRVGIFAATAAGQPNAGRVMAGATYYGIMEMSGNVYERPISAGLPEGRAYKGTHGNGNLDAGGMAANTDWPSPITTIGAGQRGGALSASAVSDSLSVSIRRFASQIAPGRGPFSGGRGVRTAQ